MNCPIDHGHVADIKPGDHKHCHSCAQSMSNAAYSVAVATGAFDRQRETRVHLPARNHPTSCPCCSISWESGDIRQRTAQYVPWWRCSDCGCTWNENQRTQTP